MSTRRGAPTCARDGFSTLLLKLLREPPGAQLSFALGSILLWVAVVDEFIIVLRGGVPTFVRAVEERHAKGDFSSDI